MGLVAVSKLAGRNWFFITMKRLFCMPEGIIGCALLLLIFFMSCNNTGWGGGRMSLRKA